MASVANGLTIPLDPPPSIHWLLNALNATVIQGDYTMTYSGKNMYLHTYLFQDLLQGHTLEITDSKAPTVLSPLLTPSSFFSMMNTQKRAMQVQALIAMEQDRMSRTKPGRSWTNRFMWSPQPRIYGTVRRTSCRWRETTSVPKGHSDRRWQHGLVIFTYLRRNTTRP